MSVQQGEVVRVDVLGDINSADLDVNSYQMQLVTAGPVADADVLTDLRDVFDTLYNLIAAVVHAGVVFRRIRAANLSQGTLIGEVPFAAPIPGISTNDQLPNQLAGVVSFKTNIPRVVLRKFYGPGAENHNIADGTISASAVGSLVGIGASLLTDQVATAGTWRYGYLSPKTQTFVVPLSASVSNIFATQRRRKLNVGA